MAQAGLNEDKTGGRKSRWTVPLMKSDFVLFYIWYEYVPKGIISWDYRHFIPHVCS